MLSWVIEMPYHIIKKIKMLHKGTSTYYPTFGIDLDDDKTWNYFKLFRKPEPDIRGKVVRLLNLDGTTRDPVNRNFNFPTQTQCYYTDGTNTQETRILYMPTALVQSYGIDQNMAIELILNEVVYNPNTDEERIQPIYDGKRADGPKDLVPTSSDGQNTSELVEDNISNTNSARLFEQIVTHPKIKEVSTVHFKNGNYRSAVLDAAIRLEEMVKQKANYPKDNKGRELSGVNLMHRVFDSTNPIISWCKNETQIGKDELNGYKLIFAGTVLGIRDTKAHAIFEISPMRALKLLTLITLLAKLVDDSQIIQE
jgi:uncharacterized protein (TIGR02391 family)